jgi:hypothetical protein
LKAFISPIEMGSTASWVTPLKDDAAERMVLVRQGDDLAEPHRHEADICERSHDSLLTREVLAFRGMPGGQLLKRCHASSGADAA